MKKLVLVSSILSVLVLTVNFGSGDLNAEPERPHIIKPLSVDYSELM
ncbi:hypothetical protein [Halalkalibacillus halophilus]|nr:hypothetical protein [Halalkalibacillus halophilus]